jgi:predicted DNA-binding transcriptional regulator YafY
MKKPTSGVAAGHSRPPLARMMKIHQALKAGGFPNANLLATELEISTKSVYRDIEFMRDRLDLPIAYDDKRFGYYYTEEVSAFPSIQISEGELVALLVAEKALQQYRGTHFEKPLVSAFRKITESLPESVSINFADWENTISFRTSAEPVLVLEVFDGLARAVAQRQQIAFKYRKPGKTEVEERLVDPYHLANVNGEWFLFAYCHLRKGLRTFVPARIKSLSLTGKTFRRPVQFSIDKVLRDSFAVRSSEGNHKVIVRFRAEVADYIREKRWHASQVISELPDGGLDLELHLSSLVEVRRWILGWGGAAVPLAPPELVSAVLREAQTIVDVMNASVAAAAQVDSHH